MLLTFDAECVCLWFDEHFSNGGAHRHKVYGNHLISTDKIGENLGRRRLCVERIILRPKRLNLK
jgi:hypothetical protein